MLGIWESSANVGIYNAAIKTAMLTSFVLISVNSIAAPKFASLYQNNDMKALGDVSRGTSKIMIILASPILVVFILFPEWVLLFFGEEFQQGSSVLMILAVGQFINVATGSVGYLLQMTGHERLVRNTLLFSAFLLVSLSIMIIPLYGVVGAAFVSASMLAVQNIIMMLLVWKYLNIITFPWVNKLPEFNS
jgi:O-antigen/teichoic acid export membrane protein